MEREQDQLQNHRKEPTLRMPGENEERLMSGNQPEVQYAAFLAIDWADQKHV